MSRFVLAQIARVRRFVSALLPKKLSRYHYRVFFVFLLIIGVIFTTQIAGAQDIANSLIKAVSWMMLSVAQICIALTIFFLRFFITLASYNNYIDVSVVKLGWVMIRDVANMFFVVALLVIAFATILGLEQYEWKKGLVKLIIMAIFINFSNMIAQLIIDIAHVFTITFLNAISATAGGNLINMFKLEKITSMANGGSLGNTPEGFQMGILGASIVATLFAIMAAVAIGAYVIIMAIRVVVLWALIILSPIAYVAYAIPKGEKYAQEWWSEFTKYVIAAPVMVFFLWLAFATLGSGQIISEIQSGVGVVPLQQGNDQLSISLSEVSSWENMANFLIAMVFLLLGIKKTQETGVEGSGMISGAVNFGKKVATIATGYAAGRWLVGKGADVGKKAVGGAAFYAPFVGGNAWVKRGKTIAADAKTWWHLKAAGLPKDTLQKQIELGKDKASLSPQELAIANTIAELESKKNVALQQGNQTEAKKIDTQLEQKHKEAKQFGLETVESDIKQLDVEIKDLQVNIAKTPPANDQMKAQMKQDLEAKEATLGELTGNKDQAVAERQAKLDKVIQTEHEVTSADGTGRGLVGWFASGGIKRQRMLGKSEKTAELAEKLAYKRTGSWSNFIPGVGVKDMDRSLKGALEAEEERSDAKTAEMSGLAKYSLLQAPRYKDGEWEHGAIEGRSVAERIAKHNAVAEMAKSDISRLEEDAKSKYLGNAGKSFIARMNFNDKAMEAAKAFVDHIKEKDLEKKFEKAAIQMNKWLTLPTDQLKKNVDSAVDPYIRALGLGHKAHHAAGNKTVRERQASDAASDTFINKLKYGTTTASTVLSDFAEKKLSELKGLERAKAMQQATNILAHLNLKKKKNGGKELEIDEMIELNAASAYLQSEAWNDDQAGHMFDRFKQYQKHLQTTTLQTEREKEKKGKLKRDLTDDEKKNLLSADEKKNFLADDELEKWQAMSESFAKLGWFGEDGLKKDGSFDQEKFEKADLEKHNKYGRRQASDLQNVALSGGDVDLLRGHHAIEEESEKNKAENDKAETILRDKIEKDVIKQKKKDPEIKEKRDEILLSTKLQEIEAIKKEKNISGPIDNKTRAEIDVEATTRAQKIADQTVLQMKDVKDEVERRFAEGLKGLEKTKKTTKYWEIADKVLAELNIEGMKDAKEMQARYDKIGDYMQHAVKANKTNALQNGHTELGYNQDYDESVGSYRFQTASEGKAKIAAERVKFKARQLVNTDQYHSNGILDQDTGIVDDFEESVLRTTLGRVTKEIELSDINLRSLLGHFYLHKNEEAQKDEKGYAIVGGDAARKKFKKDGHTGDPDVRDHMLKRGVLAHLMGSGEGFALSASKLFGHIDADQVERGEIKLNIAGKQYDTIEQIADDILKKMDANKDFLKESGYAGDEKRVRRKLEQIIVQTKVRRNERTRENNGGGQSGQGGTQPNPPGENQGGGKGKGKGAKSRKKDESADNLGADLDDGT